APAHARPRSSHSPRDTGACPSSPTRRSSHPQNGVFPVCGTHTYAEDGEVEVDLVDAFPLTITITDGTSVTVTSTANIAEEDEITTAQADFIIPVTDHHPITTAAVATYNGAGS